MLTKPMLALAWRKYNYSKTRRGSEEKLHRKTCFLVKNKPLSGVRLRSERKMYREKSRIFLCSSTSVSEELRGHSMAPPAVS